MPDQTSQSPNRWFLIGLILFTVVLYLAVYVFLHEAGHALAGLASGQTLMDFSIHFWDLSAHTALAGGLTPIQRSIQIAAGTGLPLLVWSVFIHFTPPKVNFQLHLLRLFASIGALSTLLAWIFLPLFQLFGNTYPSDDVTNFLSVSQMPPLLLTALSAGLFTLGCVYYRSKVGSLRRQFALISQVDGGTLTKGTRASTLGMTALLIFCLALTWFANLVADPAATVPDGFQQLAAIEFSSRPYDSETLAQFSLEQPQIVGLFCLVENVDTDFFDLRLVGPAGFSLELLHGKDWRANQASGLRQENLPKGNYRLVLTASQSPGALSIYIGYP